MINVGSLVCELASGILSATDPSSSISAFALPPGGGSGVGHAHLFIEQWRHSGPSRRQSAGRALLLLALQESQILSMHPLLVTLFPLDGHRTIGFIPPTPMATMQGLRAFRIGGGGRGE